MKFRKKPVVIEAHQWNGDVEALSRWAAIAHHERQLERVKHGHKLSRNVELPIDLIPQGSLPPIVEIRTLEGTHRASLGDWIICGVQGEFYPCKPDIFTATYEAA